MKEIELISEFRKSKMASIKRERTCHAVTFNPNKASPGEELYIDIPKMKMDSCLVPGSLHLLFTFKVSNRKSWFLAIVWAAASTFMKIQIYQGP